MGCLLAGGPLVGLLGLSYTTYFLGPTALFGSAVFIIFYPAMVCSGKILVFYVLEQGLSTQSQNPDHSFAAANLPVDLQCVFRVLDFGVLGTGTEQQCGPSAGPQGLS